MHRRYIRKLMPVLCNNTKTLKKDVAAREKVLKK
jgi:hypothetical protein